MNAATETPQLKIWKGAISKSAGSSSCHVAVIGAGPYGLSVAAHLNAAGIETRVFGEPLAFWRRNMPKGMNLRSPWRGSHLSDPAGELTLDAFVRTGAIPHTEPLPLSDFLKYGDWFQRNAVPNVERRRVERVDTAANGFLLSLADGEEFRARRVIVALGLANQSYFPAEFQGFAHELVSHTADHSRLEPFRGRRVAVIGRGQSACETAVLLSEAGAEVELIARGPVHWIGAEVPGDTWKWRLHQAITPPSPVGPFPLNWLVEMPGIVRRLSAETRSRISTRSLRPAASAWLVPRAGRIRMRFGRTVSAVRERNGELTLQLDDHSETSADHVMLATGYQVDISKPGVISNDLLSGVARTGGYPTLGPGLETSVPGLHYAGSSAVASFGPLMRFIWGSGYAARSITRSIRKAR